MANAKLIRDGNSILHTPVADVQSGDVVVIGDFVGVARRKILANQLGVLTVQGVIDFPKASQFIPNGDQAFWDVAQNEATTTPTNNTLIGKAIGDFAIPDLKARIRISPFGPVEPAVPITANLIGQFDADTDSSIDAVNDDDPVGSWDNISGSGTLTQTTTSKKPLYKLAVENSRNIVRYDGADDVLDDFISSFEVNDFSLFMVAKTNSGAVGTLFSAQFQIPAPDGSGFGVFIRDADPNTKLNLLINGASLATIASPSGSVQIGTLHQITCIKSGTTATIYVDGSQVATGTVPATILYPGALRRSSIGALISGGSFAFFLNGDSAQTLLYSDAKGSGDQGTIESYQKTRWNTA